MSGPGEKILCIYGNHSLEVVKNLLFKHFAKQRNKSSLLLDISIMKQGNNETLMQFYARVVFILNLLMSISMKMLQK